MRFITYLVGVALLLTTTACAVLDPTHPVFKTTYIGHTSDEVASAVRAGQVRSTS